MGALTTAIIAIVGLALGWATIEIACKPCLDKGRDAIDRNLNPDYDPDDDSSRAPLNQSHHYNDDVTVPVLVSSSAPPKSI